MSQRLRKVRADIRKHVIEMAESVLVKHITGADGNLAQRAAEFYLKTQGKDDGWSQRTELTGKGDAPIPIQITATEARV